MKELGATVEVAAPPGIGKAELALSPVSWGPDITRLRKWSFYRLRLRELPVSIRALFRAVRRSRAEIMHIQTEIVPGIDHLVLKWLGRKIPVVLTVHGPIPHEGGARYAADQARRWRCADALVVHGEEPRRFVETSAPGVPVYVVPVDLPLSVAEVSPENARNELGLGNAPIALLLGELRPTKGLGLLADVWADVFREVPDARLFVVGRAHSSIELDRLGDLPGVELRIGFMEGESELDVWAAAADVVVLPYHFGGHSGILHRAIAAHTPVLASPPLAEEVYRTKAGSVVPMVKEAWVEALSDLLQRPRRVESFSGSGHETAELTLRLYKEVLSRRREKN